MTSKEEILKTAYRNETYYWEAPMYGFIADWFLMYWEMHNLVLEHFGEEKFNTPLIERKKYEEERRKNIL